METGSQQLLEPASARLGSVRCGPCHTVNHVPL